jgi:serine phosphatase RsbU (regulator of sigma subunit)
MSSTKPQTILICDDDELIISALRGLFMLDTDYEIVSFTSPLEAAAEVARRPVDLVISDFFMPEMNGVELLGKVRQAQPDAIRILLTGFADKENAIRAINEVGLYHYLEKPWDNSGLLLLIRNALQEKSLRAQLSDKITEFERLIDQHRHLTDRHALVELELEMAAKVQTSLLPTAPPAITGYRTDWTFHPSSTLGGDFYDFARIDGRTVILLADVSGHGVQAALTSMLLKASFQEAVQETSTPGGLLEAMNTRLYRFLPSGIYACAGLVWLDSSEEGLVVANAGLPHPFVIRADGSLDELPLNGMPLGMLPNCPKELRDETGVKLAQNELLLLATDGLGEAMDADLNLFEGPRLNAALSALAGADSASAVESLATAANDFNAGDTLTDDLTIIAIQRLGS